MAGVAGGGLAPLLRAAAAQVEFVEECGIQVGGGAKIGGGSGVGGGYWGG